jgi:hypothetical protein
MRVVHCKRDPHDVYIGRPGPWGNPFSHLETSAARYRCQSRDEAVQKYEAWLLAQPELVAKARRELRGKVLGCWCAPKACHGDVLARVANEQPEGLLVRVTAPHFVAGILLAKDGRCVEAAPILRWRVGKTARELKAYFDRKGWDTRVDFSRRKLLHDGWNGCIVSLVSTALAQAERTR